MGRTWVIAIAVLIVGKTTQAQDNPWCAFFSDGHTECGFATLQGCMTAIYGKTGLCNCKTQYVPPAVPAPKAVGRTHKRSRQ
jgi:hypothetical protein